MRLEPAKRENAAASRTIHLRMEGSPQGRLSQAGHTLKAITPESFMSDNRPHVDGARVLSDLNTLRGIGAYKTGVHKPTFSEPHMRSLEWLFLQRSVGRRS